MRNENEAKFQHWIQSNVHNVPGLEDLDEEVDRLRQKLEHDLAADLPEIEAEVGDLDDALRAAYEAIHDPELGFKDGQKD